MEVAAGTTVVIKQPLSLRQYLLRLGLALIGLALVVALIGGGLVLYGAGRVDRAGNRLKSVVPTATLANLTQKADDASRFCQNFGSISTTTTVPKGRGSKEAIGR